MFGNRQSPASLPSVRPHSPLSRPLTSDKASSQVRSPKQLAFFTQINPVRLSVLVPSELSVKRGVGHARPFSSAPSSPVAQLVVCPVRGTGPKSADADVQPSSWTVTVLTPSLSTPMQSSGTAP